MTEGNAGPAPGARTERVIGRGRKGATPKSFTMLTAGCLLALGAVFYGSARIDSATAQPTGAVAAYPNLDHVGFVVKDADTAMRDVLARFGLDPAKADCITGRVTGSYEGNDVSYSGKFCMVDIGDRRLEFIEPVGSDPSPYLDALRARGDAMHHVAFMVPSIDARLERDRQHNPALHVVQDARLEGLGRYVYVEGVIPGTLVEYAELPSP